MGENQGMVWIILGVIIVGAIVITLGGSMQDKISATNTEVAEQSVSQVN